MCVDLCSLYIMMRGSEYVRPVCVMPFSYILAYKIAHAVIQSSRLDLHIINDAVNANGAQHQK